MTRATLPGRPPRRSAFTLVELLVVIGLIAILMSLLLPALGAARRAANVTKCAAQFRQIGQAVFLYAHENGGWHPSAVAPDYAATNQVQGWDPNTPPYNKPYRCHGGLLLQRYLTNSATVLFCPETIAGYEWQIPRLFEPAQLPVYPMYTYRTLNRNLRPKLGKGPRQAWAMDWYVAPEPPIDPAGSVNHRKGVNCLFADGSVTWNVIPKKWSSGFNESWTQCESGQIEHVP